MNASPSETLSRRERQIMEILFRRGEATAREVHEELPDAPTYSAVRALLSILEEKGEVSHEKRGRQFVHRARIAPQRAKRLALRSLLKTFFDGSPEKLVAAMLNPKEQDLSPQEIGRIRQLIEDPPGEAGGDAAAAPPGLKAQAK